MPTYEYDCETCGRTTEVFQSITAEPLEQCPHCGGKVQRRIHGGAGLIFKGTGFYLTDYKKSSTSGDSPAEGKSESSGDKPASAGENTTKKVESPAT